MGSPTRAVSLDQAKVEKFVERMVEEIGTGLRCALNYIGDKLGIFKAMAGTGPVTAEELAKKTRLNARYLREWLGAMVTAQYVEYDADSGKYSLPPEHAAPLADENFPFFVGGFIEMVVPAVSVAPKVAQAFRNGKGVPQSAYSPDMFEAIERGTAPWYKHQLIQKWIPAMPQVEAKLREGGAALDVGCGSGRAAITLAKAFPKARVFGFDNHPSSVRRAKANARSEGVEKRVTFKALDATKLPAGKFDFISTFDVVHDAVNPVKLMASIRRALAKDGVYLMLEMNCSANPQENMTPLGRLLYPISTLYCMTTSLAHDGAGIGAAMGEPKARELAAKAGFTHFRRLPIEDPFSVLYEMEA